MATTALGTRDIAPAGLAESFNRTRDVTRHHLGHEARSHAGQGHQARSEGPSHHPQLPRLHARETSSTRAGTSPALARHQCTRSGPFELECSSSTRTRRQPPSNAALRPIGGAEWVPASPPSITTPTCSDSCSGKRARE